MGLGQAINTAGPWKPIYLEIYEQIICNSKLLSTSYEALDKATFKLSGAVENVVTLRLMLD